MSNIHPNVHPSAVVEPGANIEENVIIEPYAVIKAGVTLKKGVIIKSHAYIDGNTTIGEGSVIWPGASIGTKTQDLKFRGEKTYVSIGKNCEIREFATINSSCGEGSIVKIGDGCMIMAYCHIAHNCELGNRVIMSNNATLAGHVLVGDFAVIGGMTPVHQFVRIGSYAMVGGMSRVTNDVPPFTIGGGIPYKLGGLNLVGLKRHKFPLEVRQELAKAYKLVYRSGLHIEQALERIEEEVKPISEVLHWLDFCRKSQRGLIGLQGITQQSSDEEFDELAELEERVGTAVH